jgi:flagellum-specific peptidoglycan hydrolase FlgJ
MLRQQFIDTIKDGVIEVCKDTHLFPSVMIAQGCLESNNGASNLSAKYNNYFGMKPGHDWKGATVALPTTEEVDGKIIHISQSFKVYHNISAGFKDHVEMLQRVGVYKTAGVFTATTPELQCMALHKAGYATDSHYAPKLIAIINENDLKQYDIS